MKDENGQEQTNLTPEALARLPRAVQHEIQRLVANVNYYRRQAHEVVGGTQGSNTNYRPAYDEQPIPMPNGARIQFHLGGNGDSRGCVTCHVTDEGRLLFYTEKAICIVPAGGINTFEAAFFPRDTPAPQAVARPRVRRR